MSQKLRSRDRALLLILKIVEPGHELRSPMWLSVHHPQICARHRDDDVLVPYFYVEVLHPVAFDATLFECPITGRPVSTGVETEPISPSRCLALKRFLAHNLHEAGFWALFLCLG